MVYLLCLITRSWGDSMKDESVVVFSENKQDLKPLINLLEQNYDVVICSYNSSDSWSSVDLHSNKNALYIFDEFPEDKDVVWVISKLVEDGVLSTTPVLFTCFDAMYDFERMGYSAFAYDVLPHPFDYDIAQRRVENISEIRQLKSQIINLTQIHTKRILNQANKLKEQNVKMQEMNFDLVELLVAAIESRDLESGQHIKRIRYFTKSLTEAVMELCPEYGITREQADHIYYASSVHDIGKIAIPDAIMLKPGRLTADEFEIMKTHTTHGAKLLGMLDDISDNNVYFKYCQEICYSHHERWDGSGYPVGLKGDEIPISAQIVSIADCYDALTSHRPYKAALSHEEAVELIVTGACGEFSPQLLRCFERVLSDFARIEEELKSLPTPELQEFNNSQNPEKIETKNENNTLLNGCENDILEAYDIIFEADLKNNFFSIVRGDLLKYFPYVPKNYIEFISQCSKICHPADLTRFNSKVNLDAFQELAKSGRKKTRIEFRSVKDRVEYLTVGFVVFKVDEEMNLIGLNGAFSIYQDDEILGDIKRGFGVTDGLTGLSLPKQFEHDVDSYINERPGAKNLMIYIDIDDMSMCNTIFGYEYGNALIKEFAGKLRSLKAKDKFVCKAASDKFSLFIKDIDKQSEVVVLVEQIHKLLRKPYHTATETGVFTATMGIARYPNDGSNYKELIVAAEYASKSAKINSKNAYSFYNNGMKHMASYNLDNENKTTHSNDNYEPKFVPVVNAKTGELVCYDCVPFYSFEDSISVTSEVYYELNKNASTRKNLSVLSIKSVLLTGIALRKKYGKVPPLSVYTMLLPDDMSSLIQELDSFVEENDCSGLDVCIIFPQDFLEDVNLRRLKTFSEHIKELGFSMGLYLIGTRYIHNACYNEGIFERYVLTSEYIARTLATGASETHLSYAASTLNNLKHFVKDITIPAKIEDFEIELMINSGSEEFSSTEEAIFGTKALYEDFIKRDNKYRKGILPPKPKVAEVDRDMLYYDLAKSPCAILTFDIKKDRLYMSPNANDVFGFDIIDYFNNQKKVEVLTFIHPDDGQKLFNALVNSRINLALTNTDVRIATSIDMKKYKRFSVNFLSIVDESGTPVRYQCFVHRLLE